MWVVAVMQNPEAIVWTIVKVSLIGTFAGWILSALGAGGPAKFIKIVCTLSAISLIAYQALDLYHQLKGLS